MPPPLLVTFVAGASGTWRIDRLTTVIGGGLPAAERLAVFEGSEARHRGRQAGFYVVLRATRATPTVPRLTLWSQASRDFLVRKRREPRLFPFARRRRGGLWLKMSAVRSSRNSLAISASAWNICRPSPGACTTVGSLASLSTSSH